MFRQALTRDPNSFEAIRGIVQVDEAKNKPADAMAFVQEQIKRIPNSPGLFMLLAELQAQAKQLKQAEDSANQVLALDKNNISAMVLLAQLQAAAGAPDKGIALYQRAIELSPRDVGLQLALGALYERASNWQQAEATYQKVLTTDSENALAANNLAYLLLEHGGSPNVALTLAQAAHRGLPNLPNSADTLGWAYYNNGGYSVAVLLLEGAVKATPNNQAFRYHLGLTYQKLNDPARARAELEKVISLNPASPLADQARHALSQLAGG
jgi:tetratricopeptide (TPR) repeat protein